MDLIESPELSNPQPPGNIKLSLKFRKIGINFSTRIVGNVVSKLFSLITIPLIARALGPESYGQFNLVHVALTYTAFLVDFGFNSYGVRESARQENSHSTVSQILSARLTIALVSILVSAVGIFIIFNHNRRLVMIVYLGFIWVIAGAMNIDYHYFGKKNMLVPTLSQLSGQVFYVVAVIIFIKQPAHLALLVLFYSLYYLWASLMGIALYLRKNQKIAIIISLKHALALLKKTFRLGICARVEMFQSSFPVIIIPALLGTYALGIFSAAFRFYAIILLVFQAIMLALAPYLVQLRRLTPGIQRKYIHLLAAAMLSTGILAAVFLYTGGKIGLDLLFGESFGASTPVFKLICLVLIPFQPMAMILGSLLIYFDLDKKYLSSTLAAGFITLVFTPLLVHLFSLEGAIWAIALSNLTNIVVSVYHVNKIIPGLLGFTFKSKEIKEIKKIKEIKCSGSKDESLINCTIQ